MNLSGNSKQRQREAEMQNRAEAFERWTQSEWVMDCLRSKTGTPLKEMSDEAIVEWFRRIQR